MVLFVMMNAVLFFSERRIYCWVTQSCYVNNIILILLYPNKIDLSCVCCLCCDLATGHEKIRPLFWCILRQSRDVIFSKSSPRTKPWLAFVASLNMCPSNTTTFKNNWLQNIFLFRPLYMDKFLPTLFGLFSRRKVR